MESLNAAIQETVESALPKVCGVRKRWISATTLELSDDEEGDETEVG